MTENERYGLITELNELEEQRDEYEVLLSRINQRISEIKQLLKDKA